MMESVGFLGAAYPWVKAAHLIFVIFWMAGLFMLPRFFAYHQETAPGSPEIAAWIEREARLIKIILNPAMIVVWALGLILTVNIGAWAEGWFYAKFAAVIALSGYYGWMAGYAKKLARGEVGVSSKAMRLLNEVPGVATAVIVVLVIVKPF
jgi:protoporphyrinogen IX oxidase